jgi:hypothetical protein
MKINKTVTLSEVEMLFNRELSMSSTALRLTFQLKDNIYLVKTNSFSEDNSSLKP